MEHQLEETEVVITDLFQDMESTVTAYGPGAIKTTKRVDGTAFFPGGVGLWRGLEPHGDVPFYFPQSPIMVLGHNFGTVKQLERSWACGIEPMNGLTWRILRRYLEKANICKTDCFFANVFVGLQPIRSKGEMAGSEEYKSQCRAFLNTQIKRVKPCIVVILGIHAAEQFRLSGCQTSFVEIYHPSYPCQLGSDGEKCASIVASEAAKLREPLIKSSTCTVLASNCM
jgi:uracil-DNA glycosylase family 4